MKGFLTRDQLQVGYAVLNRSVRRQKIRITIIHLSFRCSRIFLQVVGLVTSGEICGHMG
jgi:hypothetical protein